MFIENEYKDEYFRIIEYSKTITFNEKIYETHHIIPISLGGGDSDENLVKLSYEDHYKVHILLPFFTEGEDKNKMIYAWWRMTNRGKDDINYQEYSQLRKLHSEMLSIKFSGEGNPMFGKKIKEIMSSENYEKFCLKCSESAKNQWANYSIEEIENIRKKMSNSKTGWFDLLSEEEQQNYKRKMSESCSGDKNGMFNKKHSLETRKKIGDSNRGKTRIIGPQDKIECIYCGVFGGKSIMKRWHFDNCKEKEKK